MGSAQKRRAGAFLEQAAEFYGAASERRPMARPTLYYYSFLNLAKVLLELKGRSVATRITHGISHKNPQVKTPSWSTAELSVSDGVFKEFASALGGVKPLQKSYRVGQLMQQVVGVHQVWQDVTARSSRFVSVDLSMERATATSDVLLIARLHAEGTRAREIGDANATRLQLHRTTVPVGEKDDGIILRYEGDLVPVAKGKQSGHQARAATLSASLKSDVHMILGAGDQVRFYLMTSERTRSIACTN